MSLTDGELERLNAYLDGEATASERAEVERLLAESAEARQALEALRRVSRAVGGLERATAPRELAGRVVGRVVGEAGGGERSDRRATYRLAWALGVVGAAAGIVLAVSIGWQSRSRLTGGEAGRDVLVVADAEGVGRTDVGQADSAQTDSGQIEAGRPNAAVSPAHGSSAAASDSEDDTSRQAFAIPQDSARGGAAREDAASGRSMASESSMASPSAAEAPSAAGLALEKSAEGGKEQPAAANDLNRAEPAMARRMLTDAESPDLHKKRLAGAKLAEVPWAGLDDVRQAPAIRVVARVEDRDELLFRAYEYVSTSDAAEFAAPDVTQMTLMLPGLDWLFLGLPVAGIGGADELVLLVDESAVPQLMAALSPLAGTRVELAVPGGQAETVRRAQARGSRPVDALAVKTGEAAPARRAPEARDAGEAGGAGGAINESDRDDAAIVGGAASTSPAPRRVKVVIVFQDQPAAAEQATSAPAVPGGGGGGRP